MCGWVAERGVAWQLGRSQWGKPFDALCRVDQSLLLPCVISGLMGRQSN